MKRICAISILMIIVYTADSQYRADARKQLFDRGWKFCLSTDSSAYQKDFNDKEWRLLDLPHDWSIEGTVKADNPEKGAGGYFSTGSGWYRKSFHAPMAWKEKKVSIYFEGVYMNANVFINGKALGIRPYGYSSFYFDLSPYLVIGGENVVAVKVDNSHHINSRWYSGSGIYRHVWLEITHPVRVAHWGIGITTRQLTSASAIVQVNTLIRNDKASPQKVSVRTSLFKKGLLEDELGSRQGMIEIPAHSELEISQPVVVENPLLWSPDNPELYVARVSISKAGQIFDLTETEFGIRSIAYSVHDGLLLNGKKIKLSGGCIHHDNGCLGAAAYDRAEERKVGLLKEAGFNAVRTSHNPPSEAFLNACDRLGLIVIDEAFDCWRVGKNKYDYANFFHDWWKEDLEGMVRRDRNHPSILFWSIGNEIVERGEAQAVETATMLIKTVKRLDSSRPVTSAVVNLNKWENLDSLINVHDIAGYNYHLQTASEDHRRVPSRIIVQTESYPRDAFLNWKLVQENNFVIGDFVWTAMDYLGESGIGRTYLSGETPNENWDNDMFPWHGAYCGDIDITGFRKPISHYRSMLYNNTEKLYLAVREPNPEPLKIRETMWSVWPTWESWSWQGHEGNELDVEVYSKYPKVRLYLNDKLVGEKSTGPEQAFKATFSVPYKPGELRAVGLENDQEVESKVLRTSSAATRISAVADRKRIKADGQDLCFITIEITDDKGVLQPNADNLLQFRLEGPGTIAGVANGDLKDWASYQGNQRKAWHGRAQVVVKGGYNEGEIVLTVSAMGLEPTVIRINGETKDPSPSGPVPTANQLRIQRMEKYAFVHFSLNTYTNQSWGYGNEDINLFNPKDLDCRQWARICKQAGMEGIIITAKHHGGFCLWPTRYTDYSVKNAPWKNGKGDVVRELAAACKEYGLKLGIYLSPWDRNHPDYGKPEYITYFRNQLTELLTEYGPVFEIWFDGANGGTGYYGGANENRTIDRTTYYDWQNTYKLIRKLQPDCIIWNDGGDRGDLRWVGTEAGYVGETNWSLLDSTGEVSWAMLHHGLETGNAWVPAEVNTSIRPEWFYHPAEDTRVKTVPQLLDLYYNSIGRNGTLLLNFPIQPNGLIHQTDERNAITFAQAVKKAFAENLAVKAKVVASNSRDNDKKFGARNVIDNNDETYWATNDEITSGTLTFYFDKPVKVNRFLVQEYIPLGQRVKSFLVEAYIYGTWKELARATTIGYKRILRFPTTEATQLRFSIIAAKACPLISTIGFYNAPQVLATPEIRRNQAGEIIITAADPESEIFYTVDGKTPSINSKKYSAPFFMEGKTEVRAIAFDRASTKSSEVKTERFDIVRKDWRIVNNTDEKAYLILDGNEETAWHQSNKNNQTPEIIIDLGRQKNVAGFRYLPDQSLWGGGLISHYEFYVSENGKDWRLVSEGEFSNIKNNPLWQVKNFKSEPARFLRFRGIKNVSDDDNFGWAELDVITNSRQDK